MKMNKVLLTMAMVSGAMAFNAAAAIAPDQGSGTITFMGSIIDAPCSIAPESSNQTINLGQISNVLLANEGSSKPRNFTINLEKCDTTTKNSVSVTFDGSKDAVNNKLLGITGSAKGAGVVVTDGSGTEVTLGQPSVANTLLSGDNTLVFSAYLRGNSATGDIIPGEFTSVANFALTYP
ncbi:fimbrial protein [Morganella morganii]|uniref:fimbrial protein n=1 Tax=Morganella morganii TaxID=582 RepID=UPI000D1F59F1|nr:fimbrial protein [Morganella morganii]HAE77079.1 fimbria A protein [Morganella sp. (in: enterobacteria)]QXO44581.1 fimbrial protein [Morganella morganii]QXO48132.1 fimbrial protein [Morganella morganii]QXO51992.1 fimbrial protein [Morganella morganii]QXO55848.1 fimbrial protein [Morganella morganii]